MQKQDKTLIDFVKRRKSDDLSRAVLIIKHILGDKQFYYLSDKIKKEFDEEWTNLKNHE